MGVHHIKIKLRRLFKDKLFRQSLGVWYATQKITSGIDREMFVRYFVNKESTVKISLEMYYDRRSVERHIDKAVIEFAMVWNRGELLKDAQNKSGAEV